MTPPAPRVLSVVTGWLHFGHFGNVPMQCWQRGAPHECCTEAIPPHPTHRAAPVFELAAAVVSVGVNVDGSAGAPGEGVGWVSGAKYASPDAGSAGAAVALSFARNSGP